MKNYRKRKIAEKLTKLIMENDAYNVAQLLTTIMRSKNQTGGSKDPYQMTDEDFSSALDDTLTEIEETELEDVFLIFTGQKTTR